jgi:NADPH:quinone reductase-like Zn-dependent oxidoreductase
MRAAACERYGPPEVVHVRDVPTPVLAEGEVLVRAAATTVNSGDARLRALRVPRGMGVAMRLRFGLTRPRQPIFGFDMAGEVEAVGSRVTGFQPGDRVVGSRGFALGCHAEHVIVAERGAIVPAPENLALQDAVALLFGGGTALTFLRAADVTAGESVLINGASGAVGTMAVQLAKHMGAEVTGVCSGANVDLVRSLGADHVVDYTEQDVASEARRYDVIMDNHGNAPYARVRHLLEPGGRFLMVIGDLGQMIAATWQKPVITGGGRIMTADTYGAVMALAEAGALRPVIDTVLPFERIVDAHRRVDSGHKVGSVVLTFAADG